ncbi:MAG: peptidylprolyl isomerase [Actinomycetes bacterium]|jgi:peptidylprolyl isomerase|nr:peptidylprolyl isomerase [Actinomycetes bacterium]
MLDKGTTVRVHYTGTLNDGEQFDSSRDREPLEFVIGSGMVIPGFDAAVSQLAVGETTTVTIPAAEAYGEISPEMVQTVPLSFFGDQTPQVGWALQLQAADGQVLAAIVTAIGDDEATLDLNHPLAGKDLTFELELVEVVGG